MVVVVGRGQMPGVVPPVAVVAVAATYRKAAVAVMVMVMGMGRMIRILIQSLDPG